MRVLLVRSGQAVLDRGNVFPPMNLAGLGSVLRKAGHTVSVLDQLVQHTTREELLRRIGETTPDVVGFTSMTYDIQSVNEDISLLKRRHPEVVTVLGGTHVTSLAESTLGENPDIDLAVVGEGERVVERLFEALAEHRSFEGINGVAWRKDGAVVVNPPEEFIDDIDAIPFPEYDLLDIDQYRYLQRNWDHRRFMSILTSRGCPF
ncbi:MAG: cobalamin B12-binding domain-containing protein, partial [Deltaproteobacteria bacterium]|nr:cobalamin B12-binding domain-containing protein [Deltaproteobacteria bacterium]